VHSFLGPTPDMGLKKTNANSIPALLQLFVRDFVEFAGARGLNAFVFIFLGTIVEGVGLVLFIPIFSVIIDSQSTDGWVQRVCMRLFAVFSAESRFAKLGVLAVFLAVLMVARAIIIAVRDITIAELEVGFIQLIRSRITWSLAAARWDTILRLRHSRIVHVMGVGIQQLESATYLLLHSAVAVIMLAGQIVLSFLLAPRLAALALGFVLLGTAALLPMVRRARWIGRFVINANVSLIEDMGKFLGALKFAMSQNLQERFAREFDVTLDGLRSEQVRYVRQQAISRFAVSIGSGLGGAVVILLGIVVFDIPASVLVTLLLILLRMKGPAVQLQSQLQQVVSDLPAYEEIRKLEGDLGRAEGAAIAVASKSAVALPDGPIRFSKVSFLHDSRGGSSSRGGVRDLELIIEPGSIVGITGQSGAGKTTFADLLVGLYPPQSGDVLVDGVALRGTLLTVWRNSVSYVPQEPFLFHDTIRRNLLWANPEAEESFLWDALCMVGAEEIVRSAAHGLDTVVGERGGLLSGGERQRLCVARAILRRPRLLVLDEATSAIDVEGERALLERLLGAAPRPTTIIIAHRIQSLSYCERVLVFEGGKIVLDRRDRACQAVDFAGFRRAERSPA
jgi:ATP-binding cassette subfamily C protein